MMLRARPAADTKKTKIPTAITVLLIADCPGDLAVYPRTVNPTPASMPK